MDGDGDGVDCVIQNVTTRLAAGRIGPCRRSFPYVRATAAGLSQELAGDPK